MDECLYSLKELTSFVSDIKHALRYNNKLWTVLKPLLKATVQYHSNYVFPIYTKDVRRVLHSWGNFNKHNTANKDPWFHMFCKWIHQFNWLNSREFTGFCEQIWCVNKCLQWNHEFFTWWHVPGKPYQFWPSTTRVKLVQNSWQQAEDVYSVNTHENMYWWSGTNYEPVWHVPTGSEIVPCLLGS